ncbi:MAG: TIR domain-containing protein, partial [Luteimonas sp.]
MQYAAFLSYSHADARWAQWLLRRLEAFRVPSRLVGTLGAHGIIGPRLGKVFRDRDELPTAGDLGHTIRAALSQSAALVVVCSPDAARSHWVNAEVQAFRDLGRGDRIACFVVAGDPGSSDPAACCFPAATTEPDEDGAFREPLAADARKAGDGRERAFLKLVAGLLGVSYDALAQREAQRKQRRLALVAMASTLGMALALGLAATAYVARNDALRRQAQAEDILGFMLGDLREKLTTVGRLDLMRAVDDKAIGYFASLDPRDLSDRALEEQARSLTGIGQVRLDEGNHPEAMAAFREALARSTALYERAPGNGQRLFDLAQAEYWIGYVAWQQGRLDDAGVWLTRYRNSAIRLAAMDRDNFDWQREVAYGHHNLAVLANSLGHYAEAERAMRGVLSLYRTWTRQHPQDTRVRYEAANVASWLGSLMLRQGRLADAEAFFAEQLDGYERNIRSEPDNATWKDRKVASLVLLTEAQVAQGNIAQAKASIDNACRLGAALLKQDASNNGWRTALGTCRWWQAQIERAQQSALAASRVADATALLAAAHDTEPRNERILIWLARARQQQAQLLLDSHDIAGADRHLTVASSLLEPAWLAEPNEDLRLWLAWNRL